MSYKQCRKRAGLTQQEAASALGVSTVMIWMWETGKNNPSVSRLIEIAKLYGCTVDDLLREEAHG